MPAGIVDAPAPHITVRVHADRMGSITNVLGQQPANTPPAAAAYAAEGFGNKGRPDQGASVITSSCRYPRSAASPPPSGLALRQ